MGIVIVIAIADANALSPSSHTHIYKHHQPLQPHFYPHAALSLIHPNAIPSIVRARPRPLRLQRHNGTIEALEVRTCLGPRVRDTMHRVPDARAAAGLGWCFLFFSRMHVYVCVGGDVGWGTGWGGVSAWVPFD
jgi:hypothetical protein